MKLPSLSSLVGGVLALLSALVLTSCGGGGAAGNPDSPGTSFQILPASSTLYAGVPTEYRIVGSRKPYLLTSSEATILPVPSSVDGNSFTLLANNPGVVDTGLPAGALPIRTVTLTARGGDGQNAVATIQVAQNFLTGYGVTFSASACPTQSSTTSATGNVACAGGETGVRFAATTNGSLHGDEAFNLYILRGNAVLVDPATGANGSMITLRSDHTGEITAIIRAANGGTQLAALRVQEASTGVYADTLFVIAGGTSATTLTVLPSEFTFTGANDAVCGTGSGQFLVFDGVPPYTAVSGLPSLVVVNPSVSSSQPGVFQLTAGNASICGEGTIVVTDAVGARATVKVTTELGTTTAPTPIQISPSAITLSCGQTGSVAIAGGTSTTYSAVTSNPNLTVTVSGSILSVTRAGPVGPGTGTTTSAVTITDGTGFATVSVTSPTTCP